MRIKIKPDIAVCTQCASTLVVDGDELRCESGHTLSLEGWGGKMGRLIRNWRKWTGSSRKTA